MLLISLPIAVVVLRVFFPQEGDRREESKRLYMLFACALVILFAGLRTRYTGSPDTKTYALLFDGCREISLREFFSRREITAGNFLMEEGGFFLFTWLLAQVFRHAQWYILCTTAFMTCCVAHFIKKYSSDYMLSWVLYLCLGSFTFAMNGLRQSMAMSVCLLAYDCAKQKKPLKFLLLVLLAFTFHRTALVFLLVYPLANYKPSWFKNGLFLGLGVLFWVFSRSIASMYDTFADKEYAVDASVESGGYVTLMVYGLTLLVAFLYLYTKKNNKDALVTSLSALVLVGALVYMARYSSAQIYERVSYYFFYFIILLLPKVSELFYGRDKLLLKTIMVVLAMTLFAYRINAGSFANFQFFVKELV